LTKTGDRLWTAFDRWVEISTLPDERCQIFYRCLNSRALHRKSSDGLSCNSLGRANGYDPEFQKEHLKISGEEPTPVIPNEIEKVVSELPRDGHSFSKESATNV
jgi:hypothetical protein